MYTIPDGVVRWLVLASIKKHTLAFSAISHRFSDIKYYMISINFLTLETQVMVTKYNIRNGAIEWLVSTSMKDLNKFC